PLAALEVGVTRWMREWPQVEGRLDRSTLYLPTVLREEVADSLAQISVSDGTRAHLAPASERGNGEGESPVPLPSPHGVAQELTRGLSPGLGVGTPSPGLERRKEVFQSEWSSFSRSLEAFGSLVRWHSPGRMVRNAQKAKKKQEGRSEIWVRWHRSVPNRLLLAIQFLRFRGRVAAERERLVGGIAQTVLVPLVDQWKSSAEALRALEEQGKAAFREALASASPDPGALSRRLEALRDEGLAVLEHSWLLPLAPGGMEKSVHDLADEASTRLASVLPELSDALPVQAVQRDGALVDPEPELRDVRFREVGRQVFDVLRLEGVRRAPEPVLAVLSTARAEAGGLPEVLRFNLEAASAELSQSSSDSPKPVIEEAASLASEGMLRTEEGIDRLLHDLPDAWMAFTSGVEDLLDSSFREVHARVSAEGGVQEQIAGLGGRVGHWLRTETDRLRTLGVRGVGSVRRALRRLGVRIWRAVHFGRRVIGAAPVVSGEGDRALSVITEAPKLLAGLPLIYRRLFSFDPLSDEGLLKGRAREMAWVKTRFDSWKEGMGSPSLLTGPVGIGHTSLFNVLSTSLFSGTKLHRLELTERVSREGALAERLAGMLELSDDEAWDFSRVASAVLGRSAGERPVVVFIERLEHIFLRTPGGADLFENFLSFQAQTSGSVFWLSSMAGAAWKLVAKTEPRTASLVAPYPVAPPSREALEELILARHQRSGLPLEFRAPPDLNPLVRRRIRLQRSEQGRQGVLQTDYFDRLYRLSDESIPMAILHWLRSADFQTREGRLTVTSPSEIRYAFLEELDLDLDFALKAFLEHGSLTLEEYREVFAAQEEESYQTFEALRSRLLLEPLGVRGAIAVSSPKRVEEGERYRIPALLSQVVARRLKDRNILH
ncbi:hypothetical protein ACFL3S_05890, partial [Gemmatimonadota bacterium]